MAGDGRSPNERLAGWVFNGIQLGVLTMLLFVGLPIAIWLNLRSLSENILHGQAEEVGAMIDTVRNYYARNVVGRILQAGGHTRVIDDYADVPGAVPIPATLSIELGRAISREDSGVGYRFFSDYPFRNRAPHAFDTFERGALAALRRDPAVPQSLVSGTLFDREVRVAMPIIMTAECVSCHNAHPDSPKRDWKVGDVRGLQEVIIRRPFVANLLDLRYLLIYFGCAAVFGLVFFVLQRRQAAFIRRINAELAAGNAFLSAVSTKLSKYLSPQLYRSIFRGERDVVIATERKKLTIFFSDIVEFTATTERLQPEELTGLLNEYLTAMSEIAIRHGGTIDKFIGDAILIFFGDPETRGAAEDARACLAMAIEMQRRIAALSVKWRGAGIERPFRARIGINTGFCNVGNFGSADRMDYTIIGAEANLAARLQSIAEPGGIVLAYETYALVREAVHARALPPIAVKGIGRPIVPYLVETVSELGARHAPVIAEHGRGIELFLDVGQVDDREAGRALRVLRHAVAILEQRAPPAAAPPPDPSGGAARRSGGPS